MKIQIVCLIMTQQAINRIKNSVYTWVDMNFQGKFHSFYLLHGVFWAIFRSNGVHSVIYPYSFKIIHIKTILHSIVGNHNNIIHGYAHQSLQICVWNWQLPNEKKNIVFSWIFVCHLLLFNNNILSLSGLLFWIFFLWGSMLLWLLSSTKWTWKGKRKVYTEQTNTSNIIHR